jgi:Uma2 family endonuclease
METNMGTLTTSDERTFTVAEYYKLAEVGILQPWERVELIEGHILRMAPISEPHATIVDRLTQLFVIQSQNRFLVRVQGPIRLDGRQGANEPQPDVVLFDPRAAGHHPTPTDIYLIVEVMHSSTHRDLIDKRELYLQFQIPEFWIVDVVKREVRIHRQETGFAVSVHSAGSISPVRFPDVNIVIDELFARI